MRAEIHARKGRPVQFLAVLLLGWVGLRVAMGIWSAPESAAEVLDAAVMNSETRKLSGSARRDPSRIPPKYGASRKRPNLVHLSAGAEHPSFTKLLDARNATSHEQAPTVGHAASNALPFSIAPRSAEIRAMNPVSLRERAVSDTRWRFDGWLLLRPGVSSGVPGLAPQPSLGASQVGGVVAYRLAPDDTSDPAAYLRVSSALAGMRQQEAALGLRIRPLRGIPIATHAEVRATRTGRGTMFRPAAYVAGGVDDRPLSLDWAASGYVQAGYIAGEGATAFADGRASVDRELARLDIGSLRVGGGVWGGAQRGAARLDLGPTAQVRTALDGIPIRLSLDYRIRVAGDAQPSTGVALTLSTGF